MKSLFEKVIAERDYNRDDCLKRGVYIAILQKFQYQEVWKESFWINSAGRILEVVVRGR